MQTALFWIFWGVISFWALKTFYYSFSKKKFARLKITVLGLNLVVLTLTFLPWMPVQLGGKSGWMFALQGNFLAVSFVILLIISIALYWFKDALFIKCGTIFNIANVFLIFGLMYQLRLETFTLTRFDLPPILIVLILLICFAANLLLLQQLQLKKVLQKRRK